MGIKQYPCESCSTYLFIKNSAYVLINGKNYSAWPHIFCYAFMCSILTFHVITSTCQCTILISYRTICYFLCLLRHGMVMCVRDKYIVDFFCSPSVFLLLFQPFPIEFPTIVLLKESLYTCLPLFYTSLID